MRIPYRTTVVFHSLGLVHRLFAKFFDSKFLVKGGWGQIVVCDIGFGMNLTNNLPQMCDDE